MLGQWNSKERKYEAFSHWTLSFDKKVTEGCICEHLHLSLSILYHEVCEQGKPVFDKWSSSLI